MDRIKKTVGFLTQLYYPDMTTTAIIMTDLAEDLASAGLRVKVISAQPTYLVDERCPKQETHNGVAIRRVWSFLFDKNRNMGRLLNSTSCFLSMFFAVFMTDPSDILVLNTNPAMLPCVGYIAWLFRRQPFVILIHDLWPELPANVGIIKKGGVLYRAIDWCLTISYRKAEKIVVLSNAMKRVVAQKAPGLSEKIEIIHNWTDMTRVYPVSKRENKLLQEINPEGRRVVMYSGNLGRYQPMEVMIQAAILLKNRADILFLFAGDGAKKPRLEKMVADAGAGNIRFLPFQPLDRLAESLSMADISLLGIEPQNEGVIMPSKLYGLLAAGRPIICISAPDSEVAEIIRDAGAGVQADPDDPEALADKILHLTQNRVQADEMGASGLKYFHSRFERKKVTAQWAEMLRKVATAWEVA